VALSKQAGEQRDKGKADKGNAAARHQLFHALRLRAGVIVAVPSMRLMPPQMPSPAPSAITKVCNTSTALLKKSI